jgi:hypothetical protein
MNILPKKAAIPPDPPRLHPIMRGALGTEGFIGDAEPDTPMPHQGGAGIPVAQGQSPYINRPYPTRR